VIPVMAKTVPGQCPGCDAPVADGHRFCAECCPQEYCQSCKDATGGQCSEHQEPECTCYELHGANGGHQPGCRFHGRRA
jgi:hypothetical protein